MGYWGVGLLENDVAADVAVQFATLQQKGLSVAEATATLLVDPPWPLDDEDDHCATFLALIALQIEQQQILPSTKATVMEIICSGNAMAPWADASAARVAERQKIVDILLQIVQDDRD